jgi:hypothetical protein
MGNVNHEIPTPIWVTVPLRFRSEPRVALGTWIDGIVFQPPTQLLALGPESAPDEGGIVWLPVRAPDGREGYVAARIGTEDTLTRVPPERTVYVLATNGLRLRSEPRVADDTWVEQIVLPWAARLTALGAPAALDAAGYAWQAIRTADGRMGYVAASLNGEPYLGGEPPAPPWSYGKCLAGLHGPADPYPLADSDYAVIRTARVEAVKVLSAGDGAPGAGAVSVQKLLEINTNMFVMARVFEKPANRLMTPGEFVSATLAGIRELYGAGVRYFELHNEPNLSIDGLGTSWGNGTEFNQWFLQVVSMLRMDPGLAGAKWGFPGCSPGHGIGRYFDQPAGRWVERQAMWASSAGFMDQCATAIANADWLGVHCYWRDDAGMRSEDDGMGWRLARSRFPGKLLFITEFSNNNGAVSLEDKGRQYAEYYRLLRDEPALGAAFAYVLFWQPEADGNHESWRKEHGGLTAIPEIVGEGIAQLG